MNRRRGFTLVEMVIVIVLVGIVFAIGGTLLSQFFNSFFSAQNITEGDWQGKVAFERMARELRSISVDNLGTKQLAISASQVRFTDTDGNNVCFYLNGSVLTRAGDGPAAATCGPTSPQPLADNISLLTFSTWKTDGTDAAFVVANVYYIAVQVTVAKGDYSGTFRTNVRPRSF